MKAIQNIGIFIFLAGLLTFAALPFLGAFKLEKSNFDKIVSDKGIKSELFIKDIQQNVVGKEFTGMLDLSSKVSSAIENANATHTKNKEYDKKIYTKPSDMTTLIAKDSGNGYIAENKGMMWFLTFGLGIIGALMFIIPQVVTLGQKGIKNDHIYHQSSTNRGWIAWLVFYLFSFLLSCAIF